MPPKRLNEVGQPGQRTSPRARPGKSVRPATVESVSSQLEQTAKRLRDLLQDEFYMAETMLELQVEIESAAAAIGAAAARLKSIASPEATPVPVPGGPTRQQGQFLAYIHQYITRNEGRVAPSHANLQRFFNLTAPSVNSMLVRLEQR